MKSKTPFTDMLKLMVSEEYEQFPHKLPFKNIDAAFKGFINQLDPNYILKLADKALYAAMNLEEVEKELKEEEK